MQNMDELTKRVNKLKESELADYMENANEQFSKDKPSKQGEIEDAYNEFKRRIRNAKMHAANEERAMSMKIDILQNKIEADFKKKRELEKELEKSIAARDFLIRDLESQAMVSRVDELIEARENFLESDTEFAARLNEYGAKQMLRYEMAKMCLDNGACLIDSEECNEYKILLIDYNYLPPVSFSRHGTNEEIIKNAQHALATILAYRR